MYKYSGDLAWGGENSGGYDILAVSQAMSKG